MTCQKAIGVANDMKEVFGENLQIDIYTIDSEPAQKYNFRSSTNVLFNEKFVPIGTATDSTAMKQYLSVKIQ